MDRIWVLNQKKKRLRVENPQPLLHSLKDRTEALSVSAATMESATATPMEATSTAMESPTTYVAMESTTGESASNRAGSAIAATVTWASIAITGPAISVDRSSHEAATEPIAAAEPGPCSDKEAAAKP